MWTENISQYKYTKIGCDRQPRAPRIDSAEEGRDSDFAKMNFKINVKLDY